MTALAMPLLVLELSDALDVTALVRLGEQLDEAVALDPERLVVDLSRCSDVDPQVLRLLADAEGRLRERGGRLELRGVGPQPRRMLDLVGDLRT